MIPGGLPPGTIIGADGTIKTSETEMAFLLEQQRMQLIEMYRQATAQQCMVALIVKSMAREMADESPTPIKLIARRAKEAADALCMEIFGEDGAASS